MQEQALHLMPAASQAKIEAYHSTDLHFISCIQEPSKCGVRRMSPTQRICTSEIVGWSRASL